MITYLSLFPGFIRILGTTLSEDTADLLASGGFIRRNYGGFIRPWVLSGTVALGGEIHRLDQKSLKGCANRLS